MHGLLHMCSQHPAPQRQHKSRAKLRVLPIPSEPTSTPGSPDSAPNSMLSVVERLSAVCKSPADQNSTIDMLQGEATTSMQVGGSPADR